MACGHDRGRTTKVIQLLDVKLAKVNKRLLDTEEFNGTVANSARLSDKDTVGGWKTKIRENC